jgi:lysophospholipase L1-like esterase
LSAPRLAAGKIEKLLVIGDSYTGGSGEGGTGPNSWPEIAVSELRTEGQTVALAVSAHGGAGYVTRGIDGTSFPDVLAEAIQPDEDVIVIFGGLNDGDHLPEVIRTAVHDTLLRTRIMASRADLIVVGPAWPRSGEPSAQILAVRDVLAGGAAQAGATFVDPIAEAWFVGQPQLIGADGIHPTDAGHAYMAQQLVPSLRRAIAAIGG